MKKLHDYFRDITNRLFHAVESPWIPRILILASLIGVVGGLGAVGFHYLILFVKHLFFGVTSTATFLESVMALPWYWRLFAPAVGGLIVGPMVSYVVKEARGHGVPEVMEAVALKGGAIRFRVAPLKALVSAICIGSGGSAGREGPIVQIGASFGSSLGQFLRLTPERVKTLLAAGAAAGIAGTFNAPMAGVVFSVEVILREVKLENFSPIVISAVIGTAVANSLFGRTGPIFDIPEHELIGYWELFFYIGLGIVAAAVAMMYSNSLYSAEDIFEKISIPTPLKAALGGLLLGCLALAVPQIHSTGYPVMEAALHGRLATNLVFVLVGAKILATILTLGSGGSGGIFAPSLFIGAMTGSAYGSAAAALFPGIIASASSYAMVGMGAVFAGATHAPLTAIVILFEMTRDPQMILPLMFACIISSVATSRFQKKNIYTTKLLRRGIDIDSVSETSLLEGVELRKIMTRDPVTIHGDSTIAEAREMFKRTHYSILPVTDQRSGAFLGMLSYRTVIGNRDGDYDENLPIEEIVHHPPGTLYESDHLLKALKTIDHAGMKALPVFADSASQDVAGVISRSDIINAYKEQVVWEHPNTAPHYLHGKPTEVGDLITSALHPVQKSAEEKDVGIDIRLEEILPPVGADGNKLRWVLTNLLGNAIRHGPRGGQVEVSAWKSGDRVVISVKDCGPGLSPEEEANIFKKNKSGYALAVSREIIESYNGRLWVESRKGEGATFFLYLPVTSEETET